VSVGSAAGEVLWLHIFQRTFVTRSTPLSCSLGIYWACSLRRKHMRSKYLTISSPPPIPSGDFLVSTDSESRLTREQSRVQRESTSIGIEAAASACFSRALCLLVLLTPAGSGLFSPAQWLRRSLVPVFLFA